MYYSLNQALFAIIMVAILMENESEGQNENAAGRSFVSYLF